MAPRKKKDDDQPEGEALTGEILPPELVSGAGQSERNRAGRPEKFVDWDIVANLLELQCTQEEIAYALGMDADTLRKWCRIDHGMSWRDYSTEKQAFGKISLRRAQYRNAILGDTRMQIHLGQNWLGQRTRTELTTPGNKPLELKTTVDVKKLDTKTLEAIAAAAVEEDDEEGEEEPPPKPKPKRAPPKPKGRTRKPAAKPRSKPAAKKAPPKPKEK